MTKHRFIATGLSAAIFIVGVTIALPPETRPQTVSAIVNDKYDGDCTGTETAGRCADKCPLPTDQGTYYLQGYDKETGAAVCGFSYYHECPYASAQPADGPVCAKLTAENASNTPVVPTNPNQCGGK